MTTLALSVSDAPNCGILIDDASVFIYDRNMFNIQATGGRSWQLIYSNSMSNYLH
jgi:hypothetical protein